LATKLQLITELSESTTRAAVKNPANWTAFLKTAAHNYKYPIEDQLLIYAQRPDATACAEIELWNKLGRWVNRGAKGIALLDDRGSRLALRHVFDLSDTNSRQNRTITLWAMQDSYAGAVTETLENTFGELDTKGDLPAALISTAHNAVDDNLPDYLSELMDCRESSFLEELDDLNVEVIFKDALKSSVAYMALVRCGYPADEYLTFEDFQGIVNFNTLDTVSHLGAATSDISEMLLREIGATVKELQIAEKKQSRTFAKNRGMRHNESVKQNINSERNGEYGTDLHDAGRLPDPRPDAAGGRNAHRQIWDVAQNIPEKPQERDVRQPDAVGQAEQPPVGDRPDSEGARRENRGEVPYEQPRDGQSDRPDGLDGTHEQPETSGGGNSADGADLQLAWYDRRTEDKSLPFFHSTPLINEILRSTPHLKATKQEIADFYAAHDDSNERTEYIKGIFNHDYSELLVGENQRVGYKTYQNVLHLWEGSYTARTTQGYYDWGVIAGHFGSMILLNEFLDKPSALPSMQQQITLIEQAEDEKSSAFSISQEVIDVVLQQGSGVQDGKYRIYLQFQQNADTKKNADFLKKEYGTGGRAPALTGTDIHEWHDGKGITLTSGKIMGPDAKIVLPWSKVQKRLGELIAADRYLNSKEKEYLPVYERQMEERRQQLAEQAYAREILNREPTLSEKLESQSRENAHYAFSLDDTVYLGADEYEIFFFDDGKVLLRDVSFPLFSKELSRDDFDRMLRENPLNDHLIAAGETPEKPAEGKKEMPSPRVLYQTYLPEVVNKIRTDEIYPYLRDRNTDPDSAEQELNSAIDRIVFSMREEHPAFYEAYNTLPQFKIWLTEDVFQRTYQDYLTEKGDSVTLHADDPAAPEWVRATGDVTITREGDTVTIDSGGEDEKSYVEFDVELPDGQAGETEKQPAEKEIAVGVEFAIENRRYVIDAINEEAGMVSLRDITFQQNTGFPIFRRESIEYVRGVLEQSKEPIWRKTQDGEVSKVIIDLMPETPKQPRVNFVITDDELGHGGQKTKYGYNVAAIRNWRNKTVLPRRRNRKSCPGMWGGAACRRYSMNRTASGQKNMPN
jgi:hypothetical protein